jgi:hypothetical protein
VQNEATSDYGIVSVWGYVDENLSEIESSFSDNKIGDNLITKVAHQIVNNVMSKWFQLSVGSMT